LKKIFEERGIYGKKIIISNINLCFDLSEIVRLEKSKD